MSDQHGLVRTILVALIFSTMLMMAGALDPSIGILPGVCVTIMMVAAYIFFQSIPVIDLILEPAFHGLLAGFAGARGKKSRQKSVLSTTRVRSGGLSPEASCSKADLAA